MMWRITFWWARPKTTPPIELVETGWPKPWLFFRVLAALVIAYVALTFIYMRTENTNCVPGMMFLGAFAVPLATLTLFFELNTPRNVSMHVVVKLFLFGAMASLGVALLGYALPIFDISDMEAGIVEEVAKLLTVVVVMRSVALHIHPERDSVWRDGGRGFRLL